MDSFSESLDAMCKGKLSVSQFATPVYCVFHFVLSKPIWIKCLALNGHLEGDPVGQECRPVLFVHIIVCHNSLHHLHAWIYSTYTRVHVGTYQERHLNLYCKPAPYTRCFECVKLSTVLMSCVTFCLNKVCGAKCSENE